MQIKIISGRDTHKRFDALKSPDFFVRVSVRPWILLRHSIVHDVVVLGTCGAVKLGEYSYKEDGLIVYKRSICGCGIAICSSKGVILSLLVVVYGVPAYKKHHN